MLRCTGVLTGAWLSVVAPVALLAQDVQPPPSQPAPMPPPKAETPPPAAEATPAPAASTTNTPQFKAGDKVKVKTNGASIDATVVSVDEKLGKVTVKLSSGAEKTVALSDVTKE